MDVEPPQVGLRSFRSGETGGAWDGAHPSFRRPARGERSELRWNPSVRRDVRRPREWPKDTPRELCRKHPRGLLAEFSQIYLNQND